AVKEVRMAHLAVVGTHSTNGVAEIHSELLRSRTLRDFAEMFPERFGNQTNGVTPRRWLLSANPALARLITEAVGPGWVTHLERRRRPGPPAGAPGSPGGVPPAKPQARRPCLGCRRPPG